MLTHLRSSFQFLCRSSTQWRIHIDLSGPTWHQCQMFWTLHFISSTLWRYAGSRVVPKSLSVQCLWRFSFIPGHQGMSGTSFICTRTLFYIFQKLHQTAYQLLICFTCLIHLKTSASLLKYKASEHSSGDSHTKTMLQRSHFILNTMLWLMKSSNLTSLQK